MADLSASEAPRAPETLYLVGGATDRATYHATLACETIHKTVSQRFGAADEKAIEKAAGELFPAETVRGRTWADIEKMERRLCRVCALEPLALGVLARQGDEPTVQMSISPWPETVRNSGSGVVMTPTAAARAARIAQALGYEQVETSVSGTRVAIAQIPERAIEFVHRNFWALTPPEDVNLTPEVTAVAWSLRVRPAEAAGADPLTDATIWRLAAAACQ